MRAALQTAAGAAVLVACVCASAQTYPAKPVRMVVPFPPSGGTDVLARTFVPRLGEALGHGPASRRGPRSPLRVRYRRRQDPTVSRASFQCQACILELCLGRHPHLQWGSTDAARVVGRARQRRWLIMPGPRSEWDRQ